MRALIPFFLLIVACATVPYTNRTQFNLLSSGEEVALGNQAYREIMDKNSVSSNQAWKTQLTQVGGKIKNQARARNFRWEFNVLEGKDINAFALPGGKVAFWEGIMPVCKNDEGVAVVMGHEVAHAVAHHGAERVSQSMGLALIGEMLAQGLSDGDAEKRDQVMALYGLGVSVGVLMPWGRNQESEADRIGLILMAKAGYNPEEAPRFWRRMSQQGGADVPEFLSTHPSHATRINNLNQWMAEANRFYSRGRSRSRSRSRR